MNILTKARIYNGESNQLFDGKFVFVKVDAIDDVSGRPANFGAGKEIAWSGKTLTPRHDRLPSRGVYGSRHSRSGLFT